MKTAPRPLALLLVLLAGAGCNPAAGGRTGREPTRNPAGRGAAKDDPAALVRRAVERRAILSSLRAQAGMKIVDRPGKFTLSVAAEIVAAKPSRMRLQATKAAGKFHVFDAVLVGDEVACWVPSDKTLYRGKIADLARVDLKFHPHEILSLLLRPDSELLLHGWKRARGREGAIVLEATDGAARIGIDAATSDLLWIERLDERGPVFVKRYERWQVLPEEEEGPGALFPHGMRLEWPREERSIQILFRSLEADAHLAEEEFTLEVPDRARTKEIADIKVEGDAESAPAEPLEPAPAAEDKSGPRP